MERNVAILTMSSKNHGYCVAGVDVDNGEWIRLVSDDDQSHGALSTTNIKYQDGTLCAPLDVVKVPVIGARPLEYQPENVLINDNKCWIKTGSINIDRLLKIHPTEKHDCLLGNQWAYVTDGAIGSVGHSLVLVEVNDLSIEHPMEKSTKASFIYCGIKYSSISVTDPDYYTCNPLCIKKAILVISLPESPYKSKYYYKFIAKIFQ